MPSCLVQLNSQILWNVLSLFFFDKYKIIGVKYEDYLDFKKVAQLMEKKAHLTIEGLEDIRRIKAKMNRGR